MPQDPSSPRVAYNTILAGAAVLILGVVLVAGLAYLRQGHNRRSEHPSRVNITGSMAGPVGSARATTSLVGDGAKPIT